MEKLHPKLAAILRTRLGPRPRVASAVRDALRDVNGLLWKQQAPGAGGLSPLIRATLNSTMDCIVVLSEEGDILAYNRRFQEVWNIPAELIATRAFDRILPNILFELRHPETFERRLGEVASDPEAVVTDLLEFIDGRYFELHSQRQTDESGRRSRVWTFRDVTQLKRAEEEFRHDAFHDALTGLPNRALFSDRLGQALAQANRSNTRVAVMFIDLDRFKHVNDTLGHGAGDELLKAVASRLRARVRAQDTVARLAGDEFMILISDLSGLDSVLHVAESILDTLRMPIRVDEHALHVGASIGIGLFPDDGQDPEALMKHADIALYRAKKDGRNRYQLYESGMTNQNVEKMVFENELRAAIAAKELVVHYQPTMDLRTGEIRGVEALVRWRRAGGRLLPPARFIPIAEEAGFIGSITEAVLKAAGHDSRRWPATPGGPLAISVNFSSQQFWDPHLVEKIVRQMEASEIDPDRVIIELTESTLMHDPARGIETLHRLRALGLRVALDDFGTGHSSLSFLRHMPVSIVKIDRSFVSQCDVDHRDGAIVAAIIQMAASLNLRVVGEGVERESQAKFLKLRGCDEIQGYWLSRPVPTSQLVPFLRRSNETDRARSSPPAGRETSRSAAGP